MQKNTTLGSAPGDTPYGEQVRYFNPHTGTFYTEAAMHEFLRDTVIVMTYERRFEPVFLDVGGMNIIEREAVYLTPRHVELLGESYEPGESLFGAVKLLPPKPRDAGKKPAEKAEGAEMPALGAVQMSPQGPARGFGVWRGADATEIRVLVAGAEIEKTAFESAWVDFMVRPLREGGLGMSKEAVSEVTDTVSQDLEKLANYTLRINEAEGSVIVGGSGGLDMIGERNAQAALDAGSSGAPMVTAANLDQLRKNRATVQRRLQGHMAAHGFAAFSFRPADGIRSPAVQRLIAGSQHKETRDSMLAHSIKEIKEALFMPLD